MDSPETQNAPESKLHFLDYWRIIRIRKAIIVSVFFITTIMATVVTFLMRPEFSSTAEIEIQPDYVSDVSMSGGAATYATYDPYFMETELKAIQGEVVLERVIDDFHLAAAWGKKINPDGTPLTMNEAIDYLRGNISLDANRNTKIIDITVYDEDKDMAAKIANDIAKDYRDYRLEQHRQLSANGIAVLEKQYNDEEAGILLTQSNVDQMRAEYNIPDTDPNATQPTPTITSQQLQQFDTELIDDEATLSKLADQYAVFQVIQATNPTALADVLSTIDSDSQLSDLLGKLHDNEQKNAVEVNYLGSNSPDREATLDLANEERRQISERVAGIMIGLQTAVQAQRDKVDTISNKLDELKTEIQAEEVRGQPYWEAKRALLDKRELHQLLGARISEITAQTAIPKSTLVTPINDAVPGDYPVKPKKALQIGLGAFVGLLVGVGLAFFIEYLDTSVKTIDEVERVFQAPVLGVIPQNIGRLIEEGPDSSHAEAYRVLRTNILFSRKDKNFNTIVVVSAGMGEGKSTTALNLATVFAQAGERTLVVDSDLRRPTLHKLLGLTNNLGLINYLLKQNTLEQVIQTTSVPMLNFMASGKLPGNSTNILGSEPMRNLIAELKRRYDFILFDSPPIMGLSDASVLASEVDMAIQIIQYRRYPQLMNIRAKQMVEKVGGNLVGIVLNNINMAQDESYYYYGGYYYHSNEEATETAKSSPRDNGNSSGDGGRIKLPQKF